MWLLSGPPTLQCFTVISGVLPEQAQSHSLVLPWILSPAALGLLDLQESPEDEPLGPGGTRAPSLWLLSADTAVAGPPSLECQQQEHLETSSGQRTSEICPAAVLSGPDGS